MELVHNTLYGRPVRTQSVVRLAKSRQDPCNGTRSMSMVKSCPVVKSDVKVEVKGVSCCKVRIMLLSFGLVIRIF